MRKTIVSKLKPKVKALEAVGKKVANLESFIDRNESYLYGTAGLAKAKKDLEKFSKKDQEICEGIEAFIENFSVTEDEFYESGMAGIGYIYEDWIR